MVRATKEASLSAPLISLDSLIRLRSLGMRKGLDFSSLGETGLALFRISELLDAKETI